MPGFPDWGEYESYEFFISFHFQEGLAFISRPWIDYLDDSKNEFHRAMSIVCLNMRVVNILKYIEYV
jgi:hypothetical protein